MAEEILEAVGLEETAGRLSSAEVASPYAIAAAAFVLTAVCALVVC